MNSFFTQRACNLVLIPPIKTLLYFAIRPNKIRTIVRVYNSRFTFAINRRRDIMKESVDKEWATSRCTSLVTRQVKRQPYLFSCFLRCFTFRGPKKSTPTFENAGETCRRSAGSPAIKGGSGFALLRLQYEHRCRIFLTAVRQRTIQYCRLSSFRTCSTPSCLSFS